MKKYLTKESTIFFLFVFYPLIDFYFTNSQDFFFRIKYFYLLSGYYLLFFLLIFFIFKKCKININFFCVSFFIFFNYNLFQNSIINYFSSIQYFYFFFVYIVLLILFTLLSLKIKNINLAIFLTIFIYTSLVINVVNKRDDFNFLSIQKNIEEIESKKKLKKPIFKPNIFYILPDYFIGNPYLKDNYKYNSSLEIDLKELGFNIIKNSYSNGSSTFMAINHIFTSDYFMNHKEKHNKNLKKKLNNLWTDTEFYNYFKENGYKFNVVTSNSIFCDYPNDQCLSSTNKFYRFTLSFLKKTPFIYIGIKLIQINLLYPIFDWNHPIFDFIENFDSYTNYEPSFYYIHSLLAYGRPLRNSNCEINADRILLNEDIKLKYLENYKCVEKTITKIIKKIFQKYGDEVIIFVQSDHGTFFANQGKVDFNKLTKKNIKESLQNFSSFYLPAQCSNQSNIASLPQVNVFPLIYNCIADENVEYKPNRHFWGFHNSKEIIEIKNLY